MAEQERLAPGTLRSAFREVKRVCYAGLDSDSLHRELARRLGRALRCEAHALTSTDPDTGLFTHMVGEGLTPTMGAAFLQHVYPAHEAALFLDLARSRQVVATIESIERGSGPPSPFHSDAYRQLLRESGFERELRAVFASEGALWGTCCLMRARGSPRFSSGEQRLLGRLSSHVVRGLKTAALLDLARERDVAATGEPSAPGVVVLDSRGRVVQRNRPAASVLADLADPELPEGELPIPVLQLVGRLRGMPRLADTAPEARDDTVVRARGYSGRWYTLQASLCEPNEHGESAVVVVIQPAGRRQLAGLLAQLYGLSAREREVLALVARGEPTKRIATRLGISTYTVQDHLGNACEKVGVRGRRQLLAKLFFDTTASPLPA